MPHYVRFHEAPDSTAPTFKHNRQDHQLTAFQRDDTSSDPVLRYLASLHTPHSVFTMTTQSAPKDTDLLFRPDLLPTTTSNPDFALPDNYTIRPLARTDFNSGMLDVLRVLTTVGDITEEQWIERFEYMKERSDTYYILVVLDGEGKVVGTGGVVVERKL